MRSIPRRRRRLGEAARLNSVLVHRSKSRRWRNVAVGRLRPLALAARAWSRGAGRYCTSALKRDPARSGACALDTAPPPKPC